MSEEQRLILNMLNEGKISVEEAQQLLENLSNSSSGGEAGSKKHQQQPPRSIMDNIVETLRSGFNNLNIGFGEASRIILKETHSAKFSGHSVQLDLDVRNGSLRIQPSEDDYFHLEISKRVRAGTRQQAEDMIAGLQFVEFDSSSVRAGDWEARALKNRVNVSIRLRLPVDHIYSGSVVSKNGGIEISGVDVGKVEVKTVNGAVRVAKVTGTEVVAATVNGSISLEGSLDRIESKTTNGSTTVYSMAEHSKINVKTVNGRIQVQLPSRDSVGFNVDAKATSGGIRIEHGYLAERMNVNRMGAGCQVKGATANWDYATNKISLLLRSVNGSIGITALE